MRFSDWLEDREKRRHDAVESSWPHLGRSIKVFTTHHWQTAVVVYRLQGGFRTPIHNGPALWPPELIAEAIAKHARFFTYDPTAKELQK